LTPPPQAGLRVLGKVALLVRLEEEVARIERSGGFLSLALLQFRRVDSRVGLLQRLAELASHLRERLRTQDIVGWYDNSTLALVMPQTDLEQACRASERLLSALSQAVASSEPAESMGVAGAWGAVEGGAEAFLGAAVEACRAAKPGRVKTSEAFGGRPQLLVIDEDGDLAASLAERASELGWQASPCSEVGEALARIQDRALDALVLDVMMPGQDGPEILRESLRHQPRRPVALMSGANVSVASLLAQVGLGPRALLFKPPSEEDLRATLLMLRAMLPGSGRKKSS